MSELIRIPDRRNEKSYSTLPETRDEASQANENRKAIANLTHDSAAKVEKFLGQDKTPITVELGKTKDGKAITGEVSRIKPETSLLRVNVLQDGKPEATFAYAGLNEEKGGKYTYHVMEETPGTTDPTIHARTHDARSARSLGLDFVDHGTVYHGRDWVQDQGAMDFALTAQVMKLAADQIEAQNGAKAA